MKINVLVILTICILAGCTHPPAQPTKASPPNVILFSIDTLRADRLGAYGNPRSTSPNLDRLSRLGHSFSTVVSQSPITAPSHMTMFTSRYPEVHKVGNVSVESPTRLSGDIPTLAEQLKRNGYGTVACTDGGNVNSSLGFGRGFDMYGETGAEKFLGLVKLQPREPWFAFLHTYWVHDPYIVPSPFNKLFDTDYSGGIKGDMASYGTMISNAGLAKFRQPFWDTVDATDQQDRTHLLNLYDASIRMLDSSLRGLIDLLEELNLKDNTVLIITSDHGEEFFEHSRILHERVYSETLNVPLLFIDFRKDAANHLIETPVQLLDLAPTILDYLDLPALPGAQGRSLVDGINGEKLDDIVMHALAPVPYMSRMTGTHAWKYIFNPITKPANTDPWTLGVMRPDVPEEELYNLTDDPGERVNLHRSSPDMLETMRKLSVEHAAATGQAAAAYQPEEAQIESGTMDHLKALGYID